MVPHSFAALSNAICLQLGKAVDAIEMVSKEEIFYLPAGSAGRVNAIFMQYYAQNWCSGMSQGVQYRFIS
jgi:hypothetical protein